VSHFTAEFAALMRRGAAPGPALGGRAADGTPGAGGRYGCTSKQPSGRLRERVFPYLLHNESLMFNYDDCNFKAPPPAPRAPRAPLPPPASRATGAPRLRPP
jgi:hypothetical protein